jgi:hypothetical protein
MFVACFDKGAPSEGTSCHLYNGPCTQPCAGLAEKECLAHGSACVPDYCPICDGTTSFVACLSPGSAPPACPALPCPPPQRPCEQLASEAACQLRPDCHAVFVDPGTCDCSIAGCCMMFNRCAAGPAQCAAQPVCTIPPPPPCGGQYVTSYANGCYEGCVLSSECH